jgi:hypothetical protein
MRLEVDFSLLTETSAVGRVSGPMEFSCVPRIGETISFDLVADAASQFGGQLVVEHVIHLPNTNSSPLVSLCDVVAANEASGHALGNLFSEKYGLFFEPYSEQ